jgi:hypothetical protein
MVASRNHRTRNSYSVVVVVVIASRRSKVIIVSARGLQIYRSELKERAIHPAMAEM